MNTTQNRKNARVLAALGLGALFLSLNTQVRAQAASAAPASTDSGSVPVQKVTETEEETIQLSPFTVDTKRNEGYMASSSLAGTRLNTQLKDVSSAITVITPQFLQDTGSTKIEDLLIYTTNTEVAGTRGNFFGSYAGDNGYINGQLVAPQRQTRVRGLSGADLTRDFFLTEIPLDAYNITSVDIQRGPNSILFGLGSPAGIVNYTMKSANLSKSRHTAELRVGSYGGHREAVDFDEVLINRTLGVRINAVNDNQEFRQEGKYAHSQRATVAPKWTPHLADSVYTEIALNYEQGRTSSNRPRTTAPLDYISNWYTYLNKWSATVPYGNYDKIKAQEPFLSPYSGTGNGNWWDDLGVIYGNPGNSTTGGAGLPDAMRVRGGHTSDGSFAGSWSGVANFTENSNYALHPLANKATFSGNKRVTDLINAYESATGKSFRGFGGWQAVQLTDPSVFDFWNQSIEGPNNHQWNDFHALNLKVVQTYLNNRAGVEFVYDKQKYEDGYTNWFNDPTRVGIDINVNQRNGQANPNYGRIWSVSGTDANRAINERENLRATAFYKFNLVDFTKSKNLLTTIFGEQTFSGVASRQRFHKLSYNWNLARSGADYQKYANEESFQLVHYLDTAVNPLTASGISGLGIRGVTAMQTIPGSLKATIVDYKNTPMLPDFSTVTLRTMLASENQDQMYTGAADSKDETNTQAFIWQSRFLNDKVVGLFGLRKDNYTKMDKGTAPQTTAAPRYYQPFASTWDYLPAKTINAEGTTRTWGWMFHSPDFLNRHLPLGTTISLGYNQANNFRPSEVGFDAYGMPVAAPSGTTKDYTVLVNTLHDKLSARLTWYNTVQKNTSYGGPDQWNVRNRLVRAMNGLMVEAWKDAPPRAQTTPEGVVNKWFFGDSYDKSLAATPLPAGWTVTNHPELLNQPLRVRSAASSIHQGDLKADGTAYTEPPLSQEEIDYRKAWFAAQPDSAWFRPFNTVAGLDLAQGFGLKRVYTNGGGFWNSDENLNGFKTTSDLVAKGVEVEITANPTPYWRISVGGSRSESRQSNIMGGNMELYMKAMAVLAHDGYDSTKTGVLDYWSRPGMAYIDAWGNAGTQYLGTDWISNVEVPYLKGKASEGRSIGEMRKWHWNLVSSYDFHTGWLKGVGVGGSVRYQSRMVMGYYPLYMKNLDVWVSDLNAPIYAPSETNYDAWISYRRKLGRKVGMTVQLNLRDLFAGKTLIPISANPDGTTGQYRMAATTSWELSTRFEF